MKKILTLILLTFAFSFPVFADEDILDSASGLSREFDEQKIIPTQEYDNLINKLKNRPKKKKWRQHKELMPSAVPDEEDIKEPVAKQEEKYSATLMIPTNLLCETGIIPVGYYKISAYEADGNYFLVFLQGYEKIATVPAILSKNDYDQSTINYVQILPYKENIVKIIYGSIDYNLETILRTL